jgi:hypothetical protein
LLIEPALSRIARSARVLARNNFDRASGPADAAPMRGQDRYKRRGDQGSHVPIGGRRWTAFSNAHKLLWAIKVCGFARHARLRIGGDSINARGADTQNQAGEHQT